MPIQPLLAVLLLSPLGMFAGHVLVCRLARLTGRRPAAHTSAATALGAWLVVLLGVVAYLMAPFAARDPLSALCAGAYVVMVYGALAVLYLDVVNVAETSLHMHLLLEIRWSPRPSLDSLIARYSADRMVAERLERLTALGQVKQVEGRYYLADRSTLRLARCIDLWRTVLGLPTSPGQAAGQ